MQLTPSNINKFLFFKLPAAFWCGVRAKSISDSSCTVTVTHRWINQNPFGSMYFAVQAMAAELSTGALVMKHIRESNRKISMLVAENQCVFTKKATGKITFVCNDGEKIKATIADAIGAADGRTCHMTSIGTNEKGEIVCQMQFQWTVKAK